uniref:Tick transposon n=1 Tax=Rhipicephalus pulchellus TaxID=72859 RepID=L7M155_RHIPC
MHPQHNEGRRRARAIAILKKIKDDPQSVCFVDAAQYGRSSHYAVVAIDNRGHIISSASVTGTTSSKAEQVAIALALLDDKRTQIYSDSRSAVRAFASGSIAKEAHDVLKNRTINMHTITWFPAHLGQNLDSLTNLNDIAHSQARVLTLRAGGEALSLCRVQEFRDTLFTFNEFTKHFYLERRVFPPPHKKLTRPQAMTLRMLQTNSYPNLAFMHCLFPSDFSSQCPRCRGTCDLEHMLWRCPSLRGDKDLTEQKWSSALKSSEYQHQIWAVQRACDAAVRLGLTVPTWERPAVSP